MFTTTSQDLLHDPWHTYSAAREVAAAEHAILAYEGLVPYRNACLDAGFSNATIIANAPAQVAFAWTDNLLMVTILGSNEIMDWVGNLASWARVRWWPLPRGARGGVGFILHARLLAEPILRKIRSLKRADKEFRVIINGHSLGAAVVPFIVTFLNSHGLKSSVVCAYMFEPPRPGNVRFRDFYGTEIDVAWRTPTYTVVNVVNGETDLVTRVPFRRFGGRHVGRFAVHFEGIVLHGRQEWQDYRAEKPVSFWRGLRFVSRTAWAIKAHLGPRLLAAVRANRARLDQLP